MNQYIDSLKYAFFVIFHPFKGFWDLKYEKRGNLFSAIVILVLLVITYIARSLMTGFLFNTNDIRRVNLISEAASILMPVLLWCISSWCVTTLMDGQGTFTDIVISTAYALVPIILIIFPLTFISNFMTLEEGAFYTLFNFIAIAWSMGLIFASVLTIHEYTLGKTVAVVLITIIGIAVILFIGLLFFNLFQQMYSFVYAIYRELLFRN